MKQQTGSKSGKKYVKAAYCHPAYLTYMQGSFFLTIKITGSLFLFHWMYIDFIVFVIESAVTADDFVSLFSLFIKPQLCSI